MIFIKLRGNAAKFFYFPTSYGVYRKNQRLPTRKQQFPIGKQRLPFFEFKFQFRPVFSGYRSLPVGLPIPPKAGNRLTVGKSNPGTHPFSFSAEKFH